jgi:hypothetical protein
MIENKNRTSEEAKSIQVAEESRELDWKSKSFMGSMFMGDLDIELSYPFPEQSAEDRKAGDDVIAAFDSWARGNLDQLVLDSFEEQLEIQPIWPFQRWRDVRTAIDFLYGTTQGYCKVVTPPWVEAFDKDLHITKHNPIDDCVLDAMMLMYGVGNDTPL